MINVCCLLSLYWQNGNHQTHIFGFIGSGKLQRVWFLLFHKNKFRCFRFDIFLAVQMSWLTDLRVTFIVRVCIFYCRMVCFGSTICIGPGILARCMFSYIQFLQIQQICTLITLLTCFISLQLDFNVSKNQAFYP